MIKYFIILLLSFLSATVSANETIIDLTKSIDQIANDNAEGESISEINASNDDFLNNLEDLEILSSEDIFSPEEVVILPDMWEKTTKEDLIFLLESVNKINSPILKNELLLMLNINSLAPINFNLIDFQKLIIKSLLNLGERKKAYNIIQSIPIDLESKNNAYYNEIKLNYLLSNNNTLKDACAFLNLIKDSISINNNFFLKVDIFCLVAQEKLQQANLLNSILNETSDFTDEYFQYLFQKLKDNNLELDNNKFDINQDNIFLYSAMHQIGNIPMTEEFLNIDSINLSMSITLNNSTDIKLRLKAAHLAYFNNFLKADSIAALYQAADFSFEKLNNPLTVIPSLKNNIEMEMAYLYQLIGIQLLPITRLEALLEFWKYAEKNNLELIAYNLSSKFLNTIEPSNELSIYGPKIAKAYIYNNDFVRADKWILFSENLINDEKIMQELNSLKLLYDLFSIDSAENFSTILYDNLILMNKNLIDKSDDNYFIKNEILFQIFSILNKNNANPFVLSMQVIDSRVMPSSYIINKIRSNIANQNQQELLLTIIASIDGKEWSEIHPEHLRMIFIGLEEFKGGKILNNILLEILYQSKII